MKHAKYLLFVFMFCTRPFTLLGAVEFIGLFLSSDGETVSIEWSTASETENLGFILERKTETAAGWNPLDNYINNDLLLGQGTVSTQTDYLYVDSSVTLGLLYYYRIAGVDAANNIGYLDSASIRVEQTSVHAHIPEIFDLQIYPNPFNISVLIRFALPEPASRLSLDMYDIHGRPVERLLQDKNVSAGTYRIRWTAGDVASGIYICRVRAFTREGNVLSASQKLVLIK